MTFNLDYSKWSASLIKHYSISALVNAIEHEAIHSLVLNELPIDILSQDFSDDDCEYILVGFAGAVTNRKSKRAPVFNFGGIAKAAKLPILSIADPSLGIDSDLSLAWYAGNEYYPDLPSVLAKILDEVIGKTGKILILCGGSGGGFAALNIQNLMHRADNTITLVWNPQTNITRYSDLFERKYLAYGFPNKNNDCNFLACERHKVESYFHNNLLYKVKRRKDLKSVIMVNGYDHNHLRKQIRPFLSQEKVLNTHGGDFYYENCLLHVGCWGGWTCSTKKRIHSKCFGKNYFLQSC